MKKKILFVVLAISLLVLVIGGFFWWWERQKELKEFEKYKQEIGTIYASPKDYVIRETAEENFIENEKDGLRIKVPQGWRLEKPTKLLELEGNTVKLLSPEFSPGIQPPKGCMIKIKIVRNSKSLVRNADLILDFILESQKNPEKMKNFGYNESYEAIKIAGHDALKRIYLVQSKEEVEIGKWITIEIPIGNRIYSFETFISVQGSEKCNQEFNEFLETVSIKL